MQDAGGSPTACRARTAAAIGCASASWLSGKGSFKKTSASINAAHAAPRRAVSHAQRLVVGTMETLLLQA